MTSRKASSRGSFPGFRSPRPFCSPESSSATCAKCGFKETWEHWSLGIFKLGFGSLREGAMGKFGDSGSR